MTDPVPLEVSASNARPRRGGWVLEGAVFAGLAAWWFWIEAGESRVLCGVIAVVCLIAVIGDRSARRTARTLSQYFGPPRLTTRHQLPSSRGEPLEVELELPVLAFRRIERATLSLQRRHLRMRPYGTAGTAKIWLSDYREDVELVGAEETLEAGDVFAKAVSFVVPAREPPTGDIDSWFVVFEMKCVDCPLYEADWCVHVV